jgi:hypothetical protein
MMIIELQTIELAAIPLRGMAGSVWSRLHGEREDICEALLNERERTPEADERRELLQARLQSIDDALDELMSTSASVAIRP